jgi:Mn2+/Fe2+ NRAMP family transporter
VLILRLYIVLVVLLLVSCVGMYIFTRNRRYLEYARQTVRFTVLLLLVSVLLFVLERYVLVGWLAAL